MAQSKLGAPQACFTRTSLVRADILTMLQSFTAACAAAEKPRHLYLTGGAALVLQGLRPFAHDIDCGSDSDTILALLRSTEYQHLRCNPNLRHLYPAHVAARSAEDFFLHGTRCDFIAHFSLRRLIADPSGHFSSLPLPAAPETSLAIHVLNPAPHLAFKLTRTADKDLIDAARLCRALAISSAMELENLFNLYQPLLPANWAATVTPQRIASAWQTITYLQPVLAREDAPSRRSGSFGYLVRTAPPGQKPASQAPQHG